MNKEVIRRTGILIGGLAIGFGSGWIVASKMIQKRANEIILEEVAHFKQEWALVQKEGIFQTPGEALLALHPEDVVTKDPETGEVVDGPIVYGEGDALPGIDDELAAGIAAAQYGEALEGLDQTNVAPDAIYSTNTGEIEIKNVFDKDDRVEPDDEVQPDWPDLPEPREDGPYMIMLADWIDNPEKHDQIDITYFEGDDTLVDDREIIIPDIEGTVTREAIQRFGQYSGDPSVVYVRNSKLGLDFEITKNEGSYSEIIAGVSFREPKGSPRRMREDDN